MKRLAILGNHLPRHCGIATFTTHLADALTAALPDADSFVLAMNDAGRRHSYPSRVRFEIAEGDLGSYRRAADFLNVNNVDLLSVQHEYGIFGGKAGIHLLALLRELRMPIVTTLHTVLSAPNPAQRVVIEELARISERLVVMSASGADLLMKVHGIAPDRIDLIPHGIPHVPVDAASKDRLGVDGKTVMLTFGLLSRDKGIEHVIDALPAILAVHPDIVYIVLGATHPHVVEHEGEAYRLMLEARGQQLGVAGSMIFHNRFVSQDELTEFLSATDIYITPYLQPEQITSGTLAYAVGAGKAVISTPYIYARELLAEGRGRLVPWRDPRAIAQEVIDLVGDPDGQRAMCDRAAAYGVGMTWPAVAGRYVETFTRARTEHAYRRRTTFRAQTLAARPAGLPEMTLKHVQAMTDDTGMLQHAIFSIPRYDDGYCLDDNARALLLMALLEDGGSETPAVVHALESRYLAFVGHAFDRPNGRFRNFMSYSRQWLEPCGSEDSHGRALWALGAIIGRARDPGRQSLAGDLFHSAIPAVMAFSSPRAWAYALLGIDEYLRAFQGDSTAEAQREQLANRLLGLFQRSSRTDWPWFEDVVTYCNGRLSQALIVSGDRMHRTDMVEAGMRSLDWLLSVQSSPEKQFAAIGSRGFYERGTPPAIFDQQPVEACAMVSACLDAYRVHSDRRWLTQARWVFNWFLGENHLQHWLFDPSTGGCRDGLHVDRPNQNQGAEATLSFLLALHELRTMTALDVPVVEPVRIAVRIMTMPNRYETLFHRLDSNPILTAADWPYPAHTVFNAGATLLQDGTTLLLCRVEDRRGHSHLCAARSRNGVDGWIVDAEPTLRPDPDRHPEELWGIEDPRITYVDELGRYAVAYTAFSRGGPGVALALTEDFHTFERLGLVMQPDDKDAALLPRRINGRWAMLHRPVTDSGAHVWISFSPDLRNWGGHRLVLPARRGSWWDANRVGLSPPLIETPRGWLMLYHGVRRTGAGCLYRLGLALLDLETAEHCILRGDSWIFGPEAPYEREGDVGYVTFPCGYTIGTDGDTVNLYYGVADTAVAMATGSITQLLDWLDRNGAAA